VVGDLLDPERKRRLDDANRAEQERLRGLHDERSRRPLLSYREAVENRPSIEFRADELPGPSFTGVRPVTAEPGELHGYIDWTFFFHAWELKGRFPGILDRPEARELYDDALRLLDELVRDSLLEPKGVQGFWPAHAEGDDLIVNGTRLAMLRQQTAFGDSRPNRSLADFVAPADSGVRDHIGGFAVAIHGADALAARFEAEHDDYHAIMTRALADRLAEAFAEWLHERARREWYEPKETLSNEDLIGERFRGIRPAFGYPACPDHSEKRHLFELLGAESAGIGLTETFAMTPAAAVSGIYLGHPQARYFAVGRIGRDQVEAYAARKCVDVADAERWLRPNLGYEP
jgi:5-methyltetrahydrofolate--homocysteine methyltransferase